MGCVSSNPKDEKVTDREKPKDQPKIQKGAQAQKKNQETISEEPEIDIDIDSVIIQEQDHKILIVSLLKGIKGFELIYRGSRDGYKADTFYDQCSN